MSDSTLSPARPPEPHRYVLLHDRHPVLADLIDFVQAQLQDVLLWLNPNRPCTARALMGSTCWRRLTTEEKRLTGSVISHLADRGELPLRKAEKRAVGEVNSYFIVALSDHVWAEAVGLRLTTVPGPRAVAPATPTGRS
jgi:hypothetical protein